MAARYIERFVPTLLLFLALSNTIARAGDAATRDIIGFSPDGRYFAFEQHGVQDGSGYPYAEIFVIDAAEDKWVPGTPIRKRLDDEKATEAKVREAARADAEPILSRLKIGERGEHLAANPRAEVGDKHEVTINIAHRAVPPVSKPLTFLLREKPFPSAECARYSDQPMKGFSLEIKGNASTGLLLQDDETLPASRGCALGYGIADVFSHEAPGGATTYAVLLHVQTIGFEGPDSRFLAVAHICRQADCGLIKVD